MRRLVTARAADAASRVMAPSIKLEPVEMMLICNSQNEFVLGSVQYPMSPLCLNKVCEVRGMRVFWQLLLLFVVTCGIALVGQRILECHSSRKVKK